MNYLTQYNINYSILQKYIEKGLISEQTHLEKNDIKIYNYTPYCQYSQTWDEITTKCRGLIIDWKTNKILANPFPKFFNLEEHLQIGKKLPNEIPIIYEKMDGWLGILYWLNDLPYIATRGSFESIGAKWATKWFRDNIYWASIDREYTHLFEIIAPETKIVLNYNFQGLVHIATRHTETGKEQFHNMRIPKLLNGDYIRFAKIFTIFENDISLENFKKVEKTNEEGYVLAWTDGLRLKIKFEEYKRLHRILTNISPKVIWKYLRDDQDIKTLLDRVPDEFYKWVENIKTTLKRSYLEIENEAKMFADFAKKIITRKNQAAYIMTTRYKSITFLMLDNKEYKYAIWKLIKPQNQNTFKINEI